MRSQSATSSAIGFSQSTCFPASAAAIACDGVQVHRRGEIHGVNHRVADEIFPARVPALGAEGPRKRLCQVRTGAAHCRQRAARRIPQRRRHALPGDVTRADEAPAYGSWFGVHRSEFLVRRSAFGVRRSRSENLEPGTPGQAKKAPPLRVDVDRVERLARGHEEAVALRAAEADVAAHLRQADAPDQLAVGIPDRDAVVADRPAGVARAPEVAVARRTGHHRASTSRHRS